MKRYSSFFVVVIVSCILASLFSFCLSAEKSTTLYWEPDDSYNGITYGVWQSEADFLSGLAPHHYSTSAILETSEIGTTGNNDVTYGYDGFIPGYVHLYTDVDNISSQIVIGMEQNLTINLNGKTINNSKGFRVGYVSASRPNASLTLKNGNIVTTGGQITIRPDATLICDNIKFEHSYQQFIVAAGAQLIGFYNCNINISNGKAIFDIGSGGDSFDHRMEFINTDIVYTVPVNNTVTKSGINFIRITEDGYNRNAAWNIVFDKDSSLSVPDGSEFGWCMLEEGYVSGQTESFTHKQNFYIEEGFLISTDRIPLTYDYVANVGGIKQAPVKLNFGDSIGNNQCAMLSVVAPGEYSSEDDWSLQLADNDMYRVTLKYKYKKPLKINLLLSSDFGMKIFLPEETDIVAITVMGERYTISDIQDFEFYNGKKYSIIKLNGILPSRAAEIIPIEISFTKNGNVYTSEGGISILDYISALLDSGFSDSLNDMAVAAVEYISSAYSYLGLSNSELNALRSSELYSKHSIDVIMPEENNSLSQLSGVIKSAQLNLGSDMRMRLNLNPDYSGTLTVNGVDYVVIDGACYDRTYIELLWNAHEFYDTTMTFEALNVQGSYRLSSYVYSLLNDSSISDLDKKLVLSFYNYCAYANAYEKSANIN